MIGLQTVFQPRRLQALCLLVQPWMAWGTLVFLSAGLYVAWWASPLDYQHQETIRILYVHVPASWMALSVFATMGVMGAIGSIARLPVAHIVVKTLCPVGLVFTAVSLMTGALWGRPAWGTWWVWDARLTSMALLFVQYWGCFALQQGFRDGRRGNQIASIFVVVGLINLPIIKWSVTWWHTLHQPASLMKLGAPSIHSSFLWPLALMALGSVAYTLWMVSLKLPHELNLLNRRSKG